MTDIYAKIEAILFIASKPLTVARIAKSLGESVDDVRDAMMTLVSRYNQDISGIRILHEGDTFQMATNPICIDSVEDFIKYEVSEELTKAQLETLTVIAYMGPTTRPEIEEVRGVNCAIILRNLMMRGLIVERESDDKILMVYDLAIETLCQLGVDSASDLPNYDILHDHEHIRAHLADSNI
jgi:segregation and condensation protein B